MVNFLSVLSETTEGQLGLVAIAAAIAIFSAGCSSLGEAWICGKAIEGMTRNPEQRSSLNSTMILAVALDESCGIYALVVAILIIFVLGGRI
ncbi:MAG: ATP synthase F0 subunit C [Bacillota bacterium]|nr:ATP synthase F0 subunit C [Bacillota bacterium]